MSNLDKQELIARLRSFGYRHPSELAERVIAPLCKGFVLALAVALEGDPSPDVTSHVSKDAVMHAQQLIDWHREANEDTRDAVFAKAVRGLFNSGQTDATLLTIIKTLQETAKAPPKPDFSASLDELQQTYNALTRGPINSPLPPLQSGEVLRQAKTLVAALQTKDDELTKAEAALEAIYELATGREADIPQHEEPETVVAEVTMALTSLRTAFASVGQLLDKFELKDVDALEGKLDELVKPSLDVLQISHNFQLLVQDRDEWREIAKLLARRS